MSDGLDNILDYAASIADRKYTIRDNVPDYKDFFPEAFEVLEPGTKLKHNWHIDFICDRLQKESERIANGVPKDKDIIINIMPRSLKSYLVTIIWNAWTWAKFPEIRFVTLSYASPLSVEHSDKTRRLIKSDWYQDNFGMSFELLSSQDSKSYFINDKGGERKASSVGGQLTGSGGNILIFDDPVKPPKQGEIVVNETEMRSANSWHDSTAYNRINDPVVDLRVYVMQRLHNNDMTGHLLRKENQEYEHICIPGELTDDVKPEYIRKFYMPDKHFPAKKVFFRERFPKRVLMGYEENMLGNYAGQVLQRPQREGGGTWKEEYFTPILRKDLPPRSSKRGTGWDLATGKKQKKDASASAFVTGFRWQDGVYITNCGWVWKEFPQLIPFIKEQQEPHWIENKSAGKDAVPTLKADGVKAEEYPNENRDKFQNAAFSAAKAKKMKIFVCVDIWDKLLTNDQQGVCNFPAASWDDLHDALCIFINKMSEGIISKEDVESMIMANKRAINTRRKERTSLGLVSRGSSFRGNSI